MMWLESKKKLTVHYDPLVTVLSRRAFDCVFQIDPISKRLLETLFQTVTAERNRLEDQHVRLSMLTMSF